MTTRLTYTSGASTPEPDAAFEAALADARRGPAEPLPHLIGGAPSFDSPVFERHDPNARASRTVVRHSAGARSSFA